MIGNVVPVSAIQAKQYPFAESQGYYQGQEHAFMPPAFAGSLACKLGLTVGSFDKAAYENAVDGTFNSELTSTRENNVKRAAYDITISAPKSVSIMALVAGDDRIVRAHNEANIAAMSELEKYVRYTTKENGVLTVHSAQGIAYASFGHISSRERQESTGVDGYNIKVGPGGDPTLHTHNIVFKYVLGNDGVLRAMENSEILAARKMLDMHYKKVLSDKLRELGYKILHTKDGFEIGGVDRELMNYLSSGRNSIDLSLAKKGLTRESSTAAQRDFTNYEERVAKNHYELDTIKDWWQERISHEGFVMPSIEELTQAEAPYLKPPMTAEEAVSDAITGLTERSVSMKHRHVIAEEAMKASNLFIPLADINAEIDKQIARGDLLKRNDKKSYTSKLLVDVEKSLVDFYNDGVDTISPLTSSDNAKLHIAESEAKLRSAFSDGKFTKGQNDMVITAATTTNAIHVVVGDAGTGKSVAVSALYAAAKSEGCTVIGLAPLNRAVTALQESIPDAQTLQSALRSKKFWQGVSEDTLIVLDEAGLVDSRNMKTLFEELDKKRQQLAFNNPNRAIRGPRIVLVGDDKQYSPVESGYSFYQMKQLAEKNGSLSRLDEMRRGSTEKRYNGFSIAEAHVMARDKPELLLATLNAAGLVTALATEKSRLAYIGREYAKLPTEVQDKSLVLTGTNHIRIALNAAIRDKLNLARGVVVETFERKDLTKVAMKNAANYEEGDFLRVNMADKKDSYKKGDFLEVVGKQDHDRILVKRNGSDEIMVFNPSKSGHRVSMGRCEKIEIAPGDLLRFTAKMEKQDISNGDRGRVLSVDKAEMTMKVRLIETGEEVEIDICERGLSARYGYASTGHSTQGVTAGGNVYKYVTSEDTTTNRNSEYTDLTRSKVHYEIVTDTTEGERIEKLTALMSRESVKESALETPKPKKVEKKFKLYAENGFDHIEVPNYMEKGVLKEALKEASKLFKSIRVVGEQMFRFAVAKLALDTPDVKIRDRTTRKLISKLQKASDLREKLQVAARAETLAMPHAPKPNRTIQTAVVSDVITPSTVKPIMVVPTPKQTPMPRKLKEGAVDGGITFNERTSAEKIGDFLHKSKPLSTTCAKSQLPWPPA